MNNQKILSLLLAGTMTLSLAACSGGKTAQTPAPSAEATPAPTAAAETKAPETTAAPVTDGAAYVGEYTDPDSGSVAMEIAPRKDGDYDVQISLYRLTTLSDGVGAMGPNGMKFNATDPNGNLISGLIALEGDKTKVTFTHSTWDLLPEGESFTFTKTSDTPNLWNSHGEILGVYGTGRASMSVDEFDAGRLTVEVDWSSSAAEMAVWTMSGDYDAETKTMTYENGVKAVRVFREDGEIDKETVEYEDGKGKIVFDADKHTAVWTDEKEHAADDMVFEHTVEPSVSGKNMSFDEAAWEIKAALQTLLREAYGEQFIDVVTNVVKIWSAEEEQADELLKSYNLGSDEYAFEVQYDLLPAQGVDAMQFTAGSGEVDEFGWVREKHNVGILRPTQDGYEITDFGTGF